MINDFVIIEEPKYTYLKLIPSSSIRNYNSDKFLGMISVLYKDLDKQIQFANNKLYINKNAKLSYYIYMQKDDVQFFFIVPESHYNLFKNKIVDTWSNKITIEKVDSIPLFNKECSKYYMTYEKNDAMSLSTDKRNNVLLGSLLTTLHIMEEEDKVGVFYNFNPVNQKGWKANFDRRIDDLRNSKPIDKNKFSLKYILKLGLNLIPRIVDTVLCSLPIVGTDKSTLKPLAIRDIEISTDTKRKRESYVVNTQILCLSESTNTNREFNNALSVCGSFECLNDDNKLISKKIGKGVEVNFFDKIVKGVETMKISLAEGQNFISLPAKELLTEFKNITHTFIQQTEVPLLLRSGYISLGFNEYKENKVEAFLRDNYDQGNFPLVIIGEQGSGKTTYISNYVSNILSRGEGCMLIDYIKNCELSDSIKAVVPKNMLVELDLSDYLNAQGIGYNELTPKSNSYGDVLSTANLKALYIQMLIDALNAEGEPLSSSMDRYLSSAANIVFLDNNASLKDIIDCLNNHIVRDKYINNIPLYLKKHLDDEINTLKELNDTDKNGDVIGTRSIKVDGINHRINLLRKDFRLKNMFNRSCRDNINLVDIMDSGKILLVKMPQEYFSTPYSKNVVVTYLFTKIWASTLVRGSKEKKPKRFHLLVDEVFQSKTGMRLFSDQEILPQTRKFGLKPVFSCQDLSQIKQISQTLKSAGSSYMLLKGSGKYNYNELKEDLAPFTLEDLDSLPQYSSLNCINSELGRSTFITKLPKPL